MNCSEDIGLEFIFTDDKIVVRKQTEHYARLFAMQHPNYMLEVYNNGKLIDECLASDCFNVEPIKPK